MEHKRTGYMSFPAKGKVDHLLIKLNHVDIDPELSPPMNDLEGRRQTQKLVSHGKQPSKIINSLSSREMESLTAFCDTLLSPINYSATATTTTTTTTTPDDASLFTFYTTSASMAATPQLVGGFVTERLKHPMLVPLRLALWVLSTWFGTFLLCGTPSLSTQFPYFQRFSQIPLKKREQILRSWSFSSFFLLRMLFRSLKFLILFIFFTQVDEKNENPTWKALGYCGPDPDFINQTQSNSKAPAKQSGYGTSKDEEEVEKLVGPLYKGLVDLRHPREVVAETLRRSGFSVSNSINQRGGNKSPSSFTIRCDAVVVGSGSGGGVVAGVLAKAGYKVVVLEKGKYYARSNLSLLEGPTMDELYLGGGLLATDDVGVVVLAGSTVGGGSTINWSASIRTPEHVREEWCNSYELELFDSKLYREAMEVVCQRMGVQSEINEEGFNNQVLRRGCLELGYPLTNIPRNSSPDHYCGWCCFGCKDGRKKGTSETWLADMVDSGNGLILPGCNALRVLHGKKKGRNRNSATGVAFEFDNGLGGKDVYVVESKVTIVACGALATPKLLKQSGLRNDNIGKHLHLHPVAMAWGYFPDDDQEESDSSTSTTAWPEKHKKSYEGGIMTAMSTVVADFKESGYGAVIQTPALHPGMFSVLMPWVSGVDIKDRMCKFSRTAHVFALARDRGSGTVNSPTSLTYHMDAIDEHNLKRGLEKVLRILAAAGAEEIGTHHCKGKKLNVKRASSHEFERFVKEESRRGLRDLSTPICSAHQMGSCRMGVDPKRSAVNQRGETWEVEGLFVADTSVFPTALGVNPMVTVQAIAYCTAHSVLDVLKRKKDDTKFV